MSKQQYQKHQQQYHQQRPPQYQSFQQQQQPPQYQQFQQQRQQQPPQYQQQFQQQQPQQPQYQLQQQKYQQYQQQQQQPPYQQQQQQHPHRHPPPLPPQQPPHRHPKPQKPRRSALASCIVATIFLLFIIILISIVYFTLFKPKDPKITITAIQLPTFTLSTNSTTVSFTFSQYAAVRNPNRAVFTHFDSSLQLIYAGNQVGFMFIPAGRISAGRTEYMAATFSVQSFPLVAASSAKEDFPPATMVAPPVTDGIDRVRPVMELEVRMEMTGRVRVLWFFSHHVEALADCRVDVAINDGAVLGFHC